MNKTPQYIPVQALATVRRYFPNVDDVVDATEPASITVTPKHNAEAIVADHRRCAFAIACREQLKADGVLVAIKTAYVIFGTTAHRYRLQESTSREIVSFDRKAGFYPGDYRLRPPANKERLGYVKTGERRSKSGHKKPGFIKLGRHHTLGIRSMLGGEPHKT